ncbi:MAG: DUF4097 family beta strand repeat protein [Candidatus Eremiobacteraeota bacterium]|nr:DUF4097 family beta strand repeat protein [Candidatus Eremiobacteraeota bacterium]
MSRATVIAMLVAAEIAIVGMTIYAIGGASFASGMHQVQFSAAPIAPISAGARPQVVIDDASSRVLVGTSSDGLVHVRDLTEMRGAIFSNQPYPRLAVTRTLDGVRIERPHVERLSVEIFGFSVQRISVDVPQDARIEIARCSGADVDGIAGGVDVHSVDGHVTLSNLQGTVTARSDDGYIEAANLHSDRLAMTSMDGHLGLTDVAVDSLVGTTRDGRITAKGLNVAGDGTLQTADGPVRVSLAPNSNLTIDASTGDGTISVDGVSRDSNDSAQRTIRLGAGTGRMKLATDDGSIHILTNGAQ